MRVIVTGGAGFIGSHIVDLFIERGHSVWILDNFSSGRIGDQPTGNVNPRAIVTSPLNVEREDNVDYLFRAAEPDVIIHQAAQPSLLRSVNEPQFDAQVNIIGTLNVIEASRRCGAHVIMASTSAVYDDASDMPYKESGKLRPTRPYGIAKCAAEMYLRESGIPYTILRYGNVYGPRQIPVGENQLVPHALDHIFKGKEFIVNGDGNQRRDFVYVGDVAEANYQAAVKRVSGTFNIAHGVSHSVNEVLTILGNLTEYPYRWQHGDPKPKEPRDVRLDVKAAYRHLDFTASVPLLEGLKNTVHWYESQLETVEV